MSHFPLVSRFELLASVCLSLSFVCVICLSVFLSFSNLRTFVIVCLSGWTKKNKKQAEQARLRGKLMQTCPDLFSCFACAWVSSFHMFLQLLVKCLISDLLMQDVKLWSSYILYMFLCPVGGNYFMLWKLGPQNLSSPGLLRSLSFINIY